MTKILTKFLDKYGDEIIPEQFVETLPNIGDIDTIKVPVILIKHNKIVYVEYKPYKIDVTRSGFHNHITALVQCYRVFPQTQGERSLYRTTWPEPKIEERKLIQKDLLL